jgi:type VI secretion system protein ImpB
MSQSHPPTLDRARRPRVRITYDAEEGGGVREVELPLVVGVLADLSGRRSDPSPGGEERHFTPSTGRPSPPSCGGSPRA